MSVSQIFSSFNAGEISPELYGEVSLAKLDSAATTARNMFVAYRGGLQSRAGLAFVGRCMQRGLQPAPRLIPFQFSITQGTILEWGEKYLRFVFDGAYVVEDPINILSASKSNPATIGVTGTPFDLNDWVFIAGVVGMTQLNGETFQARDIVPGSFNLYDLDGNPINSTGYTTYISGGVAARIYTLDTPYNAEDLPYLKFSQSADVMSLTCSNPTTGNEYPPYELKRFGPIDWTLTPVSISVPIIPPDTVTAASQKAAPASGINATFGYVVTAIDKDGNESIASVKAECHGADIEVEGGTNIVSWSASIGAVQYNIYRSPAVVDTGSGPTSIPDGAFYGFVGASFGTQFADTLSVADLSQTPPLHANPLAPGQILAVNILTPGSGLTNLSYAINTSTGSNFLGYPLLNGGALAAFVIVDPGQDYADSDTITFSSGTFATGYIEYPLAPFPPVAGDTVTFNGVVFTYVSGTPTGNQVKVGASAAATLQALVSALSASLNASLIVASYSFISAGNRVVVTYKTVGTGGNAYTLAFSTFGANRSGATLTGGSTTSGTIPTATLTVGPQTGTWPGVVTYFQQRRFFANSFNNPDTFWASQTGLFNNFDTRIPTQPNDAITASPWTEQVNGIQWLIPMPGGQIAMTGKRAWQIQGEGTYQFNVQPLTPSSVQAQPQAFNGSSPTIPPIVENYDILYVQAIGNSTVRDLSWNLLTNIYTGADLTILSSHLFQNYRLIQWAWAREPYKVLWAGREDGTMLSFTYLKEQEVYGWARHDTQGLVCSVATITEPPVDSLYAVVKRFPPGQLHGIYITERMDDRLWQSVEDTYAVDSGVSNPMRYPDTPLQAGKNTGNSVLFSTDDDVFTAADVGNIIRLSGGIARVIVYLNPQGVRCEWILSASNGAFGLPYATPERWSISTPVTSLRATHLAGATVSVLADGVPLQNITVGTDGTIALPFAASDVKAGLAYTAQMQTPYINGGQPTIQGRRKVITACTVRLASSGGFDIGTNQPDGAAQNPQQIAPAWSNMTASQEAQQGATTYQSPAGQTVTQLWTGDVRQTLVSDWKKPGQVAVQQTGPLPLEVIAVIPEKLDGDTPESTYSPKQDSGMGSGPRPPGRHMLRI